MSANASPRFSDETSAEPPAEDLLGKVLGERYVLEAVLGRGSMGTVYRARHRRLGRDMAVKVLRPALVRDADAVQRFQREALAISRLDHENCVQVIDFGCEDGLEYLVMQLLDGPSLRDLTGRPMPVGRAIDLVVQILHGLEHAHRRGLVHRDLKPENVIVVRGHGDRDIAKLVDFGLAQMLHGPARRLTRAGVVFGTPLYISPEQATGGKADPRTDVYAAGVILYELLSGEPPFFDEDPATVAAMHVTREPPPLPHGLPLGLSPVIRKMLAKRGEDRHRTAHAAASALRRALAGTSSAAPRTTAPYTEPDGLVARALVAASPAPIPREPSAPRRPTVRPFRVDPPPPGPERPRATTSVDASLPPVPPSDPPQTLRPSSGRALWIAPVPTPELARSAAFARVDHALVERSPGASAEPPRARARAIALRVGIVVAIVAAAIAIARLAWG